MSQDQKGSLLHLYRNSKLRLFPLSDPLDVAFPLHRQLSTSREEVYSDWLQWVLEQIKDIQQIGHILGSPNIERLANSQELIKIEREIPVEHGHLNQTGRLDIVICQGPRRLAVIEVKTRTYEDADLEKQDGYRKSINSTETELIFLAVNPPASDTFGFRFLSWADVCANLRGIIPYLLAAEHILSTALTLAFIGAVEQNLLGLISPESSSLPISKVPRIVDHFTRAAMEVDFWKTKNQQ